MKLRLNCHILNNCNGGYSDNYYNNFYSRHQTLTPCRL